MKFWEKKKASRVPHDAQTSVHRPNVMTTQNAFLPAGGGNIDHGAATAYRVAAETRMQVEQQKQKDQLSKEAAAARMHESIHPQQCLRTPTSSKQYASLSVKTLIDIDEINKPKWAHTFSEFGLDAGMMSALETVYFMELERAVTKMKKEKIRGDAVDRVIDEYGGYAARAAQSAFDKMGITVGVSFYRDPVNRKTYYEIKIPANEKERDAWKQDLIRKYNLKT